MPGLLRGVARTAVVAGTASSVAGRVNRRQQKRWAQQDAAEAQGNSEATQSQTQSAGISDDQLNQLERLGRLKDDGILTEAEFQQEKNQILNS